MYILKSYVYNTWFTAFIMSIVILTFILVMGNFIQLAELVITKGVNIVLVLKLFSYLIPYLLIFAIPMGILTSALLTFNRLSCDNEITAMRASGISLFRVIQPVILTALMLSIICLHLNDTIIPKSHFLSRKTLIDIGLRRPTAALEPKTFIKAFKGAVIFIYQIKNNYLYNIRIYQPQPNKPTRIIIANSGEFIPIANKKEIKLKLIDGTIDESGKNDAFYKLNFKTYYMPLVLAENQNPDELEKKPKDMTLAELRKEIDYFKRVNIDIYPLLTEFHKKISISFASFIFALIAIPLGIKTKRREYSISFGISLVLIIIYYLIVILGEVLSLKQIIPAPMAMWIANIIFLLIGLNLSWNVFKR
ncbi:MAG: LptF/LptG family permease [Candidatus Omnitrophota bacterium]